MTLPLIPGKPETPNARYIRLYPPRDVEKEYFIHIMMLENGPRTYGPFDTHEKAEDWARSNLTVLQEVDP